MAECQEDKTWTTPVKHCHSSRCGFPPLSSSVSVSDAKASYDIGEKIVLSCPDGSMLVGENQLICDSSLNWSPNPENTHCRTAAKVPDPKIPEDQGPQCQRWEKPMDQKCTCIPPFQCPSSLAVCATMVTRSRTDLMTVCKMQALLCRGMTMTLAEDSACSWPNPATTPCDDCQLWETCNGQTGSCRCKTPSECVEPGASVCVRIGDGRSQTMSECEAGLRRCNNERVVVVDILPCPT